MMRAPRPPRLAHWILQRALPADIREGVSGDIEEIFRGRWRSRGAIVAWLWYWIQALAFLWRFSWERLRDWRRLPHQTNRIGQARQGDGLMRGSWLDFKLGLRMLVRFPGLTLVGGLGMAVAVAIGAGFFAFFFSYMQPALPLDEGHRVIGIETVDATVNDQERRIIHDFETWRAEMKSVQDLGAFRMVRRNLIADRGHAEPVGVAEISAAGFRVARVPPLLGRYLVEDDERHSADPVIVIGYDVWQQRFGSSPSTVGRTIRLGNTVHTIVGVMPDGFGFPVNHRFWTPLRAASADYERRQGPDLNVFGRLAPGASISDAQSELDTIARRTAAESPGTHAHLRPRVLPYTALFMDGTAPWQLHVAQFLISLLLVVICANVAILVYARTATRRAEIAVRSALGASRRRIVAQLFVEALVFSGAAAAAGLLVATVALRQLEAALAESAAAHGGMPFWVHFGLSWGTVLYVGALAVVGAVIVGVVPALHATGRRAESSLRQLGGSTGMRLGTTWTTLIVAQVAIAVAILPPALFTTTQLIRSALAEPAFPADQFLTARLEMDREPPPAVEAARYRRIFAARYGNSQAELAARFAAEPEIAGVTFAAELPGTERSSRIHIDGAVANTPRRTGDALVPASEHEVQPNRVDANFFEVLNVPLLTGRPFAPADMTPTATAVVVNRRFVEQLLGDGSPLGRRIRYRQTRDSSDEKSADADQWYEVVGVVENFPAADPQTGVPAPRMYHPLAAGDVYPVNLALRTRGGPAAPLSSRVREITTSLDPTLRLHEVMTMDALLRQDQSGMRIAAMALTMVTLSVLLLSAAGIYALMSFAVIQRRKEIGIRAALGADPRRILGSIFSRSIWQLAAGILLGVSVTALFEWLSGGELLAGQGAFLIPGIALLMTVVGLLAALGPARQGLRIQPTEALREQ